MINLANKSKQLLTEHSIDIFSEINFDINGKIHTLSFTYIIDTFMQASEDSKEVFYQSLQAVLKTKDTKIENFFESMGQLLLMTHLSKNLDV